MTMTGGGAKREGKGRGEADDGAVDGGTPADDEWLRLENQLCFPFYAVSRLITRRYRPLLEEMDLTYPQYLVLLALWEADGVPVQVLSDTLFLNTNTLTPLLKRLELRGLVTRRRESADERVVTVRLTEGGRDLKARALGVPAALIREIDYPAEDLLDLRKSIKNFLKALRD